MARLSHAGWSSPMQSSSAPPANTVLATPVPQLNQLGTAAQPLQAFPTDLRTEPVGVSQSFRPGRSALPVQALEMGQVGFAPTQACFGSGGPQCCIGGRGYAAAAQSFRPGVNQSPQVFGSVAILPTQHVVAESTPTLVIDGAHLTLSCRGTQHPRVPAAGRLSHAGELQGAYRYPSSGIGHRTIYYYYYSGYGAGYGRQHLPSTLSFSPVRPPSTAPQVDTPIRPVGPTLYSRRHHQRSICTDSSYREGLLGGQLWLTHTSWIRLAIHTHGCSRSRTRKPDRRPLPCSSIY
jgi:hypothetical protein